MAAEAEYLQSDPSADGATSEAVGRCLTPLALRQLTPLVLDQLLLHSHMLGYVAVCTEQSRRIRCESMSRSWCLLINRRGSHPADLCALAGIKALCNLAPTCRSLHDATRRLALCLGCLRGTLHPRDAKFGRKRRRFRLPCGHTTCGCAYGGPHDSRPRDLQVGCPKCSYDVATSRDLQTLSSNQDPRTLEIVTTDDPSVGKAGDALNSHGTAICKFWAQGNCQKGGKCNFAHGHTEISRAENVQVGVASACGARVRRTAICKYWDRGDCKNGNLCNFAHGATKLRYINAEPVGAHPEDKALFVALDLGPHQYPPVLATWHRELEALQPGQSKSYPGLRPAQRKVLHKLADKLGCEHMSTGVGERQALRVCRPVPMLVEQEAIDQNNKVRASRAEQRRQKKLNSKHRGSEDQDEM